MNLTEKVTIIVPSTINGDQPAPELAARETREVLAALALLFGGATLIRGQGAWLLESGRLVTEDVSLCFSNTTPEKLAINLPTVHEVAHQVRRNMAQEAVAIEVNGTMTILTAADYEAAQAA